VRRAARCGAGCWATQRSSGSRRPFTLTRSWQNSPKLPRKPSSARSGHGLDLKTRTLICVISDATNGRDAELKLHLRMAHNQGWTEDELVESLLHLGGYVGAPLIREALLTAKETFAEMRAEK
jgi:alkylhydroperoxidase/carboxymuconolactone decarboxylase family protein YurZ